MDSLSGEFVGGTSSASGGAGGTGSSGGKTTAGTGGAAGTGTAGAAAGTGGAAAGTGGVAAAGGEGGDGGEAPAGGSGGEGGSPPEACVSTNPDLAKCTCVFHDNHDYWFCDDAKTFAEAETACTSAGHQLVELSGAVEDAWVYGTANPLLGAYWLGTKDETEGTWAWRSGGTIWQGTTTGAASGYVNWASGEPNDYDADEDCATVQTNDEWFDWKCGEMLSYVCEAAGGSSAPEPFDCGTGLLNMTCTSNDGHDYVYSANLQAWEVAKSRCESLGMHLVSIDDATENSWVHTTLAQGTTVWTAGHDVATNDWRWDDGTNTAFWSGTGSGSGGLAVGGAYTDWDNSIEPNGSGDCMLLHAISGAIGWDDQACTIARNFVCESN